MNGANGNPAYEDIGGAFVSLMTITFPDVKRGSAAWTTMEGVFYGGAVAALNVERVHPGSVKNQLGEWLKQRLTGTVH